MCSPGWLELYIQEAGPKLGVVICYILLGAKTACDTMPDLHYDF